MKVFSILQFLIITSVFWACSSTNNLSKEELTDLEIEVEYIESDTNYYLITTSNFDSTNLPKYKTTLNLLHKYYPDDIQIIHEEFDNTQENRPILKAEIKDHPFSLNKVLWNLGPEYFQSYFIEYTHQLTKDTPLKKMPEVIGGIRAIQQEINYPNELRQSNISGRVFVNFIVNEFGEVEDPDIVESLHVSADMEAIRVIRKTKFTPAEIEGVPVRVRFSLPIHFRPPN